MIYGEDLALVHDRGFTAVARAAAETLICALRESGIDKGLVVDLGCGSGVVAGALVAAGFETLGVDSSPDMIAIARSRVPGAQFVCGPLASVSVPSCVAVSAVGEVLNYVTGHDNDRDSLPDTFLRVRDALAPGGLLLFDLAEPGRCPGGATHKHAVADDWAVIADSREDSKTRMLTRSITTFRRQGDHFRRTDETHVLCLYPRDLVLGWLRGAGFEARVLDAYGSDPFPPGVAAFLARRG